MEIVKRGMQNALTDDPGNDVRDVVFISQQRAGGGGFEAIAGRQPRAVA